MGTCGLLLFLTAVVVGSAQLVSAQTPFMTVTCNSDADCTIAGDYCQTFHGLRETGICVPATVSGLARHYITNYAAALRPQTAPYPYVPTAAALALAGRRACVTDADCPTTQYCASSVLVAGGLACAPRGAAPAVYGYPHPYVHPYGLYNPYFPFRTDAMATDPQSEPGQPGDGDQAQQQQENQQQTEAGGGRPFTRGPPRS